MFDRFEFQIGLTILVAGLLCALLETLLNSQATWLIWGAPFLFSGLGVASANFFVRRKLDTALEQLLQGKNLAEASDFSAVSKTVEAISSSRTEPLKQALDAARADIANKVSQANERDAAVRVGESDSIAREHALIQREIQLFQSIDDAIDRMQSAEGILERVLHQISQNMSEITAGIAVFSRDGNQRLSLASVYGLPDDGLEEQIEGFEAFLPGLVTADGPLLWDPEHISRLKLELPKSCVLIVALPLKTHDRFLGYLMLFSQTKNETDVQRIQRVCRQLGRHVSRALIPVALAYEHHGLRVRDQLTGALNRSALADRLSSKHLNALRSQVGLILVEGDNFFSLNESLGRERGDQLIKTLHKTITDSLKVSAGGWTGYRTGAAQFAILIDRADQNVLLNLASRVSQAVAERKEWPGNKPQWTVSCAISSHATGENPEDFFASAEDGLAYLRSQKQVGKIIFSNQIPGNYRKKRRLETGTPGDLASFDPVDVINSASVGMHSGLLHVVQGERQFWLVFEKGVPKKAQLEKLCGDDAVIEFVTTFDEGQFQLFEEADVVAGFDGNKLGPAYDVSPIEKLLLDAHLAKDKYGLARCSIPNIDLFSLATTAPEQSAIEERLRTLETAPTAKELATMVEIMKLSQGSISLKAVFSRLDGYTSVHVWNCAAILLQQGLISLKTFKISGVL